MTSSIQHSDSSLFGTTSIKRASLTICPLITLLLVVLEPEITRGYGFGFRSLFWALHMLVGAAVGLFMAQIISWSGDAFLIKQRYTPILILITGIIGAVFVTPFFSLIHRAFPDPTGVVTFHFEIGEWVRSLPRVFGDVYAEFLVIWGCVNLPVLIPKPVINSPPSDNKSSARLIEQQDTTDPLEHDRRATFFDSLPTALGKDLIAVSSDLHYINVHTSKGRTLILGSLKHISSVFSAEGMMVHRSHWVSKRHVRKLSGVGDRLVCVMSNGLHVPVSRSRRKAVLEQFGQAEFTPPNSAHSDDLPSQA